MGKNIMGIDFLCFVELAKLYFCWLLTMMHFGWILIHHEKITVDPLSLLYLTIRFMTLVSDILFLFIRQVPQFTVVELYTRMRLRNWLEIFSGMMNSVPNGTICYLMLRYWKSALWQEQVLYTGLKRFVESIAAIFYQNVSSLSPFAMVLLVE